MIRSYSQLVLLLLLMMPGYGSQAAQPYLQENRVLYIEKALKAFQETKLQNVINTYKYINVVERNNCRSSLSDLKVECLLSFARKNCSTYGKQKSKEYCELYSDIIIANKLSESAFIKRSERYRVTRNTKEDFRTALTNRLHQKYGKLVTDFYLTDGSECNNEDLGCLAAGLDQFCLDYTNAKSLSWQYCTSASLWFIGTSKQD
jgi:ribosomal protein S24E